MSVDIHVNDLFFHVLNSKARVIVNYGGRDSGKSFFTGGQYIPLAMLQEKYFRGVGIRKTLTSTRDSVYTEIKDGITLLEQDKNFTAIKNPQQITCKNGNKMLFRGLDDPVNLKSIKGINFIWVEEAEDLSEREYFDLLILLRGEGYQRLMLTYNPLDEDHFSKSRFVDVANRRVLETFSDGDPKVWEVDFHEKIDNEEVKYTALVICSTYNDNMFISPIRKLVIEQLKETDRYLYDVYAKGKYGKKGGRILTNVVYEDFESKKWKFENFDNKGYAQDFGFNHANATLSIAEKDNCLYVFDEIYEYEKDTDQLMAIAKQRGIIKSLPMICDCAEPDKIQTWRRKGGYNAKGVKKYNGSVNAQIDTLKTYDKIYVNTTCTMTAKEVKSWSWKLNKQGNYTDEPVKIFDDAMAALRYSTDIFEQNTWGFNS